MGSSIPTERRTGRVAWALAALALLAAVPATAGAQTLGPEQAIERALAASPELRAALFDAIAAREASRAAENGRRPVFVANVNGQHTENLSGTAAGVVRNLDRRGNVGIGLRYTTAIGTVVELDVTSQVQVREVNRDPSTTQLFRIGPVYSGQASLFARQPLLRGRGTSANLAEVRETEELLTAAEQDYALATSQLVRDLLVAYWELWYAERALGVEREALALTEREQEETRQRFEALGTATRADVLQFATEASAIREAVASAEATMRARAIELGRFLGLDPSSSLALSAETTPPDLPGMPSSELLIESARLLSPELAALTSELEAARVRVAAARDASRPRLDAVGQVATGGVWTDDTLPGLQLPGDRPAVVATLGFELELPIGPSRGRADYARARAQLASAEARYEARDRAIAAEIASRYEALEAARSRLELARETARVAAELAEAERARMALGTTTATDVLRAQQSERETELRALRALVDAVSAGLDLEHLSGRLLDRFSIEPTTEAS